MARPFTPWLAVLLLAAGFASAGTRKVELELRVQPELELEGTEKIYLGPIVLEPRGGDAARQVDINAIRELEQYTRRLLRRQTRLSLLPVDDDVRPPTDDIEALKKMPEFWTELGKATGADYIVAASIDVEVLDREGYQTEKYVSPEDGKTYFRQVLVEETGFKYDLLLLVMDGKTGRPVHSGQITDFKPRHERKLNDFKDMFTELYTLENKLLGVFVPRKVRAYRYLHTR